MRTAGLVVALGAIGIVACGALPEGHATALSGGSAADQPSVDRSSQAGPLPPVAAGQATRVGPAGGAVVIRSAQEYAIPTAGHFAVQFPQARYELDSAIHTVAWTANGSVLAARKGAAGYELVRITQSGTIEVVMSTLKDAYVAVVGETALVLGPAGYLVVVDPAGRQRPTTVAPARWTAEYVKVSPDGAHLAALEGNDLFLYDIGTGARTRVATGIDPIASPIGWTWTGHAVLFGRTDAEGSSLWRYEPATGLMTKAWAGARGNVSLPSGTPRGIVFEFLPRGTEREALGEYWQIPPTGGPTIFLRRGSGLSVSRDGSTFSFSRTIGAPGATGVYIGGLP